jgi:5-hmdU DNA kinase, helical domain
MSDSVTRFVKFILARHRVYVRRQAGKSQPWSSDPILQRFKFCNVFREDDRVTRWLATEWRGPHENDKHLWFAFVVARRCVNWPDTLADLGYPVPWDEQHFLDVLERRRRAGKQVFNSEPYKLIISGQSGNLGELQAKFLLNLLWQDRHQLRPHSGDTLRRLHTRLAAIPFMGGFHAAQVVADLKYVGRLRKARDWWEFAASGPGSRRGLNRVLRREVYDPWQESEWIKHLNVLREAISPALEQAGLPRMHAQDTQNCLCEFDKYERIREGGKGRKFTPNPKPLTPVTE